jgi:LysM repeat protein
VRVVVAGLKQDVSLLSQQIKSLRLEIEEMQRQNARLRSEVTAANSNNQSASQISSLTAAVESIRSEYRSADEAQKKQIIAEVTRQIEALSAEMQSALNTVAGAVNSQPNIKPPVRFSEDYPKTGITYTVKSGDTLSGIARAQGSTVKHIQNANKIADPARDLQVGQTIFIPIAE